MPIRHTLTVLVLSLAAVAEPSAQGRPEGSAMVRAYQAAIAEYRSGHRETAVETALSWARVPGFVKQLRAGMPVLEERRSRAEDLEWRDVEAAVLLHTDAAVAGIWRDPPVRWQEHLKAAQTLVDWLDELDQARARSGLQPSSRAYQAGTWYVATMLSFSRHWQHWVVEGIADKAAERYPGSVDIQLAAGAVSEALYRWERRSLFSGRHREAARRYRAAAAAGPGTHEAGVRLGHLLWRSGRGTEAEVEFKRVLGNAQDPRVRYLAHLLLGRILQGKRELGAAAAEYAAAVASQPAAQAARTALASVRLALGQPGDVWPTLEAGLDPALPRSDFSDPFWSYDLGPLLDLESLLAAMRDAVRR